MRDATQPVEPGEEADEEDEMYWYQGDHLDLAPMLREQVILAAPDAALVSRECLDQLPMWTEFERAPPWLPA